MQALCRPLICTSSLYYRFSRFNSIDEWLITPFFSIKRRERGQEPCKKMAKDHKCYAQVALPVFNQGWWLERFRTICFVDVHKPVWSWRTLDSIRCNHSLYAARKSERIGRERVGVLWTLKWIFGIQPPNRLSCFSWFHSVHSLYSLCGQREILTSYNWFR